MLLENVSAGDSFLFKGFAIPGYALGRWIVMDSGDVNQDGFDDLLVGSFASWGQHDLESGDAGWLKNSPMFMILLNRWAKP